MKFHPFNSWIFFFLKKRLKNSQSFNQSKTASLLIESNKPKFNFYFGM